MTDETPLAASAPAPGLPAPTETPAGPTPVAALYPYPYGPPAPERPGRTLGIVGFVLAFIGFIDVAGLIISIVALVRSKRAGEKNGFALAGIFVSIATILFCAACLAVIIPSLVDVVQTCGRLGNGVHVIGNSTYTCTPTSANVYTSP